MPEYYKLYNVIATHALKIFAAEGGGQFENMPESEPRLMLWSIREIESPLYEVDA